MEISSSVKRSVCHVYALNHPFRFSTISKPWLGAVVIEMANYFFHDEQWIDWLRDLRNIELLVWIGLAASPTWK